LARHATATAGEDFYRLLDILLQKAAEALPPMGDARTQGVQATPPMLRTVLEIFALCLAQGFSGMYFSDAKAISDKLTAISRFVPELALSLATKNSPRLFPEAYPEAPASRNPLNRLRSFDWLDWLLWLTPPLLIGLLYHLYDERLQALLEALTGSQRP
jgi:type VI protein secretion system component VasF